MSAPVQVGEDIIFLGQPHRIVDVQPYVHPDFPGEAWVIATDAYGWSITVPPALCGCDGEHCGEGPVCGYAA